MDTYNVGSYVAMYVLYINNINQKDQSRSLPNLSLTPNSLED